MDGSEAGGSEMDVVREVLDKLLVNRDHFPMGRVDGIIVEMREGRPPLLTCIETGPAVSARRISKRLARKLSAFVPKRGPRRDPSFRIPWSRIRHVGVEVEVEIDARETPAAAWEQWIRDHVIARIPGA